MSVGINSSSISFSGFAFGSSRTRRMFLLNSQLFARQSQVVIELIDATDVADDRQTVRDVRNRAVAAAESEQQIHETRIRQVDDRPRSAGQLDRRRLEFVALRIVDGRISDEQIAPDQRQVSRRVSPARGAVLRRPRDTQPAD